jgi:NitT/TauT family transport system permease protein
VDTTKSHGVVAQAPPPRRRRALDGRHVLANKASRDALLGLIPFAIGIVCWQFVAANASPGLALAIPSPLRTWLALRNDVASSALWSALGVTMQEVLLGLLFATLAGCLIGTTIGLSRIAYVIAWPFVVFFQAIPKIALAPLMIIVFGFGVSSKVAVAAAVAFFPITVGVSQGMRSVRLDEIDLLRSLSASPAQLFVKVRVRRALPATFSGFQVGVTLSLLGAVVTEFVGASNGIGYLIASRGATLNVPGMYSAIIVLSLVAVIISMVLSVIDRRLSGWQES